MRLKELLSFRITGMAAIKMAFAVSLVASQWGCTETVEEPLNLPVQLKGNVTPVSEFGFFASDALEGIVVSLQSGAMVTTAITDSAGNYEMNVSSGTYKMNVSKEGFGKGEYQGIALVGGALPSYYNPGVFQKSSSTFTDLELSFSNNLLTIEGVATHNYPVVVGYPYWNVKYVLFLSDSPEVSATAYKHYFNLNIDKESGEKVNLSFNLGEEILPSGSTIYAIVHGVGTTDYGYVDSETGKRVYPSLNDTPSNVASVQIP